ncbi:carboxymuconolactone decarboxylase family protein [Yinghuangia sp. YIM S09857]|uniref:carboxymuconolactone decarboxylase family protein n=1 Tax=Yinghuangia sp. YIM S09857 TaxID=3436929 RepID=UPI003F537AF7
MTEGFFPDHTVDSAPAAARRALEGTAAKFGYLPSGAARMAESPEAFEAFLRINATFENTTLDKLARETVIFTVATRNGCELCVALHTGLLTAAGADAELIAALRDQAVLPDARLEAVRRFTLHVLDTSGAVEPDRMREFLGHGFTTRNALEVVLGIGAYTLSTFANRLTDAPVDEPMLAFAWRRQAA